VNGQVSSERGEPTLPPAARSDAAAIVAEAVPTGGALDERQAKVLLAGYGIAVPKAASHAPRTRPRPSPAARRPVAIKAVGPHISHKTEKAWWPWILAAATPSGPPQARS